MSKTRGKWGEIGDYGSREDAEEAVRKERERSPHCKYSIREQRRQSWWGGGGETRYIVYQLCEGVY